MDKNTILGFALIAAILIGFSILNRPSEDEVAKQKAYNDSIALVQQSIQDSEQKAALQQTADKVQSATNDSLNLETQLNALGDFKNAAIGTEKLYVLENELVKITLSSKGGKVVSAQLKISFSRFITSGIV